MPGDFDESVDRLRAFNALLATIQPGLHSLATELDGIGHQLADDEAGLRDAINDLHGDVDVLAKEVTESATDAVHAAEELTGHLHQELDTALPALEQQVAQVKEQLGQTLHDQVTALDTGLGTLQHQAFELLDALLAQQLTDFSAWAGQGDEAFSSYLKELEANAAAAAGNEASDELAHAAQAVDHDAENLSASHFETEKVDSLLPEEFGKAMTALQAEIHTFHEQQTHTFTGGASAVAQHMEELGAAAIKAIDEAVTQALAAVDGVSAAIESLDTEVERAAVDNEGHEGKVATVAALAPKVAEAEKNVVEIREILEAMANL